MLTALKKTSLETVGTGPPNRQPMEPHDPAVAGHTPDHPRTQKLAQWWSHQKEHPLHRQLHPPLKATRSWETSTTHDWNEHDSHAILIALTANRDRDHHQE